MTLSLICKGINYVDLSNNEYSGDNSPPAVAASGADSDALTPDWGTDRIDRNEES